MDNHDLFSLFGLNDKPDDAPAARPADTADKPRGRHAIKLDKWGVERGERLHAKNAIIRMTLSDAGIDDALARSVVADAFGAAYEPDPTLAHGGHPCQQMFFRALLDSAEWRASHCQTLLADLQSEIAAANTIESFADFYRQQQKASPPADAKPRHWADPPKPDDAQPIDAAEIAAMNKVARANKHTQQELSELQAMQRALGTEHLAGSHSQLDATQLASLFKQVRGSNDLRRIMDLAGRYRRLAQSKQRAKQQHGVDEIVGITLGNDVGRLLNSELVKLCDPDLEIDVMRRIIEHQAMVHDVRGVEPTAQGPVMVLVDESQSMEHHDRIYHAKALALAMAWIAQHQRRWCCLVAFAGVGDELRTLTLPTNRWPQQELLAWLEAFIEGGTRFPLDNMPDLFQASGAPRGKTDVLMITDGQAMVPPTCAKRLHAWKARERAKFTSLVLGDDVTDVSNMHTFSDAVYQIADCDLGVGSPVVGEILSL